MSACAGGRRGWGHLQRRDARAGNAPIPQLRAAAADYAGTILRTEFSGRATVLLIGLCLVPVVATIVLHPHGLNGLLVAIWSAFAALILRRRRGLRRSIEVNQD